VVLVVVGSAVVVVASMVVVAATAVVVVTAATVVVDAAAVVVLPPELVSPLSPQEVTRETAAMRARVRVLCIVPPPREVVMHDH
jgi:hypothetical protein